MKIKTLHITGFEYAIKGMRLSRNSQDNSDSVFLQNNTCSLGEADLLLMQKLIKAGDEHAKCMQMVDIWFEMQVPRYFWQQFDTYRVGVTKCSESTMYTLMKGHLTQSKFENYISMETLNTLNDYIRKGLFDELKNELPEGFLQTRIIKMNYQTTRRIYMQRKNHKLKQWDIFCKWVETLPYANELIILKEE